MSTLQGKFRPKNPSKYKGDPSNIIYRSSWELKLFRYLDIHPHVIQWQSEEVIVRYKSPIDNRWHSYYPDVVATFINKDDKKETFMIEVKPDKETRAPLVENKLTKTGKISKRFLHDVKTWGINQSKWKYAEEYCKDRGWKFVIFTEKNLGLFK